MTTPVIYTLRRHRDVSNVSGTGDVATIVEFGSGLTVLHWDSDTPSVQVHTDIRHIEQRHGHNGASTLELNDTARLLGAYWRVTDLMLLTKDAWQPTTVKPHPGHPDRLRLTFSGHSRWRWWVEILDGSEDAAVHEEVNGEMEHRWCTPDGDIWLSYFTPLPRDENPLDTFHKEDR